MPRARLLRDRPLYVVVHPGPGLTAPCCPLTGRQTVAIVAYDGRDLPIGTVWFTPQDGPRADRYARTWNHRGGPFDAPR